MSPSGRRRLALGLLLVGCSAASLSHAQDWDFATQIELGAVFTEGNTNDENIRFRARFDATRARWTYGLNFDGLRSSSNDELAAQRLYSIGMVTYNFDPDHFVQGRLAHEEDRFSGYDSQSDFSLSYGQVLLRDIETMSLRYTVGAGMRSSRGSENGDDDFDEGIVRLAADYSWDLSDTARFIQTIGVDAGERSTISRSETSIESDIVSNLSMKFTVKVRHQTEVPVNRKKTDTEASVTLLLRF